jgi:predicted Zn-dependent peptidase
MDEDNPESVIHEMFTQNFWRGHPLGLPILGTPETVPQFSRDTLLECFHSWYAPNNIVITAAGNLEHTRLVDMAVSAFGGAARAAPVQAHTAPQTHASLEQRHKQELEQVHIVLGVPSYPLAHERRYAASLLNIILGGGMSSRLFQNIRERQGLAYAIFSDVSPYTDSGVLSVYAGTSRETTGQLIRCVVEEFRESTSARISNLARQAMYFNRFLSLDEMLASIEIVTREEVLAIAHDFFEPGRLALTVLGNLKDFQVKPELLAYKS